MLNFHVTNFFRQTSEISNDSPDDVVMRNNYDNVITVSSGNSPVHKSGDSALYVFETFSVCMRILIRILEICLVNLFRNFGYKLSGHISKIYFPQLGNNLRYSAIICSNQFRGLKSP